MITAPYCADKVMAARFPDNLGMTLLIFYSRPIHREIFRCSFVGEFDDEAYRFLGLGGRVDLLTGLFPVAVVDSRVCAGGVVVAGLFCGFAETSGCSCCL